MVILPVAFDGAVHVVNESDAAVPAGTGLGVIGPGTVVPVAIGSDVVLVVEPGPAEYGCAVLVVTVFRVVDSDAVFVVSETAAGPGIETGHLVQADFAAVRTVSVPVPAFHPVHPVLPGLPPSPKPFSGPAPEHLFVVSPEDGQSWMVWEDWRVSSASASGSRRPLTCEDAHGAA